MKKLIKIFFQKIRIYEFSKKIIVFLRVFFHFILRDHFLKYLILNKFYKNHIRRVHLGCGERKLKEWLNVDIYTGDIFLDLNKKLPFKNNSIDYVYSHHLIEHLEQQPAIDFLKEIYQICRHGAKIRLVTPDLDNLIKIFQEPEKYQEIINFYCKETKFIHPVEFLNMTIRQLDEHKYIYNFDFLKMILEKIGFKNITKQEYGKSEIKEFDKLDFHGYEIIDKISLIVEAEK